MPKTFVYGGWMFGAALAAFALSYFPQNVRNRVGEFRYDPVELVRTGKSAMGAASLNTENVSITLPCLAFKASG